MCIYLYLSLFSRKMIKSKIVLIIYSAKGFVNTKITCIKYHFIGCRIFRGSVLKFLSLFLSKIGRNFLLASCQVPFVKLLSSKHSLAEITRKRVFDRLLFNSMNLQPVTMKYGYIRQSDVTDVTNVFARIFWNVFFDGNIVSGELVTL